MENVLTVIKFKCVIYFFLKKGVIYYQLHARLCAKHFPQFNLSNLHNHWLLHFPKGQMNISCNSEKVSDLAQVTRLGSRGARAQNQSY